MLYGLIIISSSVLPAPLHIGSSKVQDWKIYTIQIYLFMYVQSTGIRGGMCDCVCLRTTGLAMLSPQSSREPLATKQRVVQDEKKYE